ncbi:hypothetical protein [Endothiovibrio diazotrophicus]
MTTTTPPPSSRIVVPVHLAAFCIGTPDLEHTGDWFAGAMTDYRTPRQGAEQALIGQNVVRPLDEAPLQPLEQGIHLHWKLPGAMTTGSLGSDGSMTFPAVPNRWLVTRLVIDGGQVTPTSWVVISDYLSTSQGDGQSLLTLPVQDDNQQLAPAYAGLCVPLATYRAADYAEVAADFQSQTGSPLTAVASGEPAFAAFYPNCRNLFGFHDSLDDLEGAATVSYVVSGWYSEPDQDIAHGYDSAAALEEALGWQVSGELTTPVTLCYGVCQGIPWNPATRYLADEEGPTPPAIAAGLGIGNTSAEALSAYYAGKFDNGDGGFQQLFTALQYGLLDTLAQPTGGQLANLYLELLASQFATTEATSLYAIYDTTESPAAPVAGGTLPAPLADGLNRLNQAIETAARSAAYVEAYRWQLFADWCHLVEASGNDQAGAEELTRARYEALQGLLTANTQLTNAAATQQSALEAQLPASLTLRPVPGPLIAKPAELNVVLDFAAGSVATRPPGASTAAGLPLLPCRLSSELVSQLQIDTTTLKATQYAVAAAGVTSALLYGDTSAALIEEACLFNGTLGAAHSGQAADQVTAALADYLAGQADAAQGVTIGEVTGAAPAEVAISWWNDNAAEPLLVAYTVSFLPMFDTLEEGAPMDYGADFITGAFTIDPAQPAFLSGSAGPPPASADSFTQQASGFAPASSCAAQQLEAQLTAYLAANPDETLQEICNDLAKNSVFTLPLAGLSAFWLTRRQALQLPIEVAADSPYANLTAQVAAAIGSGLTVAPAVNGDFNPLRAGWLSPQLTLVDRFGGRHPIDFSEAYVSAATSPPAPLGDTLPTLQLPPRLVQGGQLAFRWVGNTPAALAQATGQPASSPICGWLLADHLQEGFFLYQADGMPLGSLTLNGDGSALLWQSAPGDNRTIGQDLATVMATAHPQLAELAQGLAGNGVDYFRQCWSALTATYGALPPNPDPGAGYAWLIGRPVALTQIELALHLDGMQALNQSFDLYSASDIVTTGNGVVGVQFPVVLGGGGVIPDGVLGYFLGDATAGGFDFGTFYSSGAQSTGSGVETPTQATITLTAQPGFDPDAPFTPPQFGNGRVRAAVLCAPHLPLHASTGILPTAELALPQGQVADALANMELWLRASPLLRGQALRLPVPRMAGYGLSFVEPATGDGRWQVTTQLEVPTGGALWGYSPQSIVGGWLRFNRQVLSCTLGNASGGATLTGGSVNNGLSVTLSNDTPVPLTFTPGTAPPLGGTPSGSVFYLQFGAAVATADVAAITLANPAWRFTALSDASHGAYWAATPAGAAVTLAPGATLTLEVGNLTVAPALTSTVLTLSYAGLAQTPNGVFQQTVAIQPPTSQEPTR